jgi:hypothetical protein
MKMLETRISALAFALTLNPSPKQGEGLQSGSPSLFLGVDRRARVAGVGG